MSVHHGCTAWAWKMASATASLQVRHSRLRNSRLSRFVSTSATRGDVLGFVGAAQGPLRQREHVTHQVRVPTAMRHVYAASSATRRLYGDPRAFFRLADWAGLPSLARISTCCRSAARRGGKGSCIASYSTLRRCPITSSVALSNGIWG
jgi:hypothetical protein